MSDDEAKSDKSTDEAGGQGHETRSRIANDLPPGGYYLQVVSSSKELDVISVLRGLRRRKLLIWAVIGLFAVLGWVVGIIVPDNYRASVVVATTLVDSDSENNAEASSIPYGAQIPLEEATAILESRAYLSEFIREHDLLPVLFPGRWNRVKEEWKRPSEAPTVADGFKHFSTRVLGASTDPSTNLTSVDVSFTDAVRAAEWANKLVAGVNELIRERDIAQSERMLTYLRRQVAKTGELELQSSLYEMMETELGKIAAARVQEDYVFRVIDPAVVEQEKAIPHLKLIIMGVMVIFGSGVGIFLAVIANTLARVKRDQEEH